MSNTDALREVLTFEQVDAEVAAFPWGFTKEGDRVIASAQELYDFARRIERAALASPTVAPADEHALGNAVLAATARAQKLIIGKTQPVIVFDPWVDKEGNWWAFLSEEAARAMALPGETT